MNHSVRWAYDAAEFGDAVRRARLAKNWDQSDLARVLNVSRMTVSRLERGQAVSLQTAMDALSECGWAIIPAPKFSNIRELDE